MAGRSKAPGGRKPVLVLTADHARLMEMKAAREERMDRPVALSEIVHQALDELERAEAS